VTNSGFLFSSLFSLSLCVYLGLSFSPLLYFRGLLFFSLPLVLSPVYFFFSFSSSLWEPRGSLATAQALRCYQLRHCRCDIRAKLDCSSRCASGFPVMHGNKKKKKKRGDGRRKHRLSLRSLPRARACRAEKSRGAIVPSSLLSRRHRQDDLSSPAPARAACHVLHKCHADVTASSHLRRYCKMCCAVLSLSLSLSLSREKDLHARRIVRNTNGERTDPLSRSRCLTLDRDAARTARGAGLATRNRLRGRASPGRGRTRGECRRIVASVLRVLI